VALTGLVLAGLALPACAVAALQLPSVPARLLAAAGAAVALAALSWLYRLIGYESSLGQLGGAGDRELAVERVLLAQRRLWSHGAVLALTALLATALALWAVARSAAVPPAAVVRAPSSPRRTPAPASSLPAAIPPAPSRPTDPGFFVFSDDLALAGAPLGFRDLDRACQVQARNYLCLLNRGEERVAGGQRLVATDPEATFEVRWSPSWASVEVHGSQGFSIDVAAPKGKKLQEGLYTGAERFASAEVPELDTHGCNQSAGKFQVRAREVSFGSLRRLTIDFVQFCERHGNPIVGRVSVEPDPWVKPVPGN
jgi:hypothetical protein